MFIYAKLGEDVGEDEIRAPSRKRKYARVELEETKRNTESMFSRNEDDTGLRRAKYYMFLGNIRRSMFHKLIRSRVHVGSNGV